MTADREFLPQLDGVRALSIAFVLALHCVHVPDAGLLSWLVRHGLSIGWVGVDLFFALSGFLITRILLRTKGDPRFLRNFYGRRFLRIFPLYYGVLILLWAGGWRLFEAGPIKVAWPYFTYLSNFYITFSPGNWPPLAHTWSLAIEEQYYLVFPTVVLLTSRVTLSRILWAIILISPIIRASCYQQSEFASHFLTYCRLDVLAMGGLAGIHFDQLKQGEVSPNGWLKPTFYALLAVVFVLFVTKNLDLTKFWPSFIGLSLVDAAATLFVLLAATRTWKWVDHVLCLKPVRGLGKISYGVYLLHFPILFLVLSMVPGEPSWTRTLIVAVTSIVATILLAAISWKFFEAPILSLKRHFEGPRPVDRIGSSPISNGAPTNET